MKRTNLIRLHCFASMIAAITIAVFFSLSLYAEINGNIQVIKSVKAFIVYALPIMIVSMPIIKISGDRLAGTSRNPIILTKKRRMRFIIINGVGLLSLALFLFYRSHYQTIDKVFLIVQVAEFCLGLSNLLLLTLNALSGRQLSKKIKR